MDPNAPDGETALKDWVKKGMHGEMAWLAKDTRARADLRSWFPEAKSVVMAIFSYRLPSSLPRPRSGRIARYARPPDYHDRLKALMQEAQSWITGEWPETKVRHFVDTSPLLERHYARWAGVGWIGKNTMILSRNAGSYFLLAGLALDRELAPDEPVSDHCGSCTRCLDVCPTEAFVKPRVLDASRCIAYFTVEHRKNPIPEPYRARHGQWLFGCDDCQDVCPWNRFAKDSRVFQERLPDSLDLAELAALGKDEFNRRFKGTPLRRTGWTALVRNALLAMGNSKDGTYRAILERFSSHEEPLLRDQALWSLQRLDEPN